MKKRLMAAASVCIMLAIAGNALAADANQPKVTPKSGDLNLVIGIVTVLKDNDGNIVEVKVKATKDLIYKVVLDEKGIELGRTMVDKRARIEGFIDIKDKVQWLTVKTFSDLKPPTKPNQAPKPAPRPAPRPAPKPKY